MLHVCFPFRVKQKTKLSVYCFTNYGSVITLYAIDNSPFDVTVYIKVCQIMQVLTNCITVIITSHNIER